MGSIAQQLNHANSAVMKFAMPFWGKPRWAALMVGIANEIQELENAAIDVIVSRQLANATGPRLRVLAKHVGQPYDNYSESDLRLLVGVRIAINRSEGRWSDVLRVCQLLGLSYILGPDYPAGIRAEITSNPSNIDLIASLLQQVVSAGVSVMTISGVAGTSGFVFDDDGPVTTPGGGFSDSLDLTVGSAWTFVV